MRLLLEHKADPNAVVDAFASDEGIDMAMMAINMGVLQSMRFDFV